MKSKFSILYKSGKYEEAVKICDEYLKSKPNDYMVLRLKGDVYNRQHKYEEALQCHKDAIEQNKNYATAYVHLGKVLVNLSKYEEAIQNFTKAIELKTDYIYAYRKLADVYRKIGSEEEATKYSKIAYTKHQKHITEKSKIPDLYTSGNYVDLVKACDEQLKNTPNDYILIRLKGDAYSKLQKYEEAKKCYNEALVINENYPTGYVHLGKVLVKLGYYDEAVQNYKKAITLDQEYAYAYRKMADTLKIQELEISNRAKFIYEQQHENISDKSTKTPESSSFIDDDDLKDDYDTLELTGYIKGSESIQKQETDIVDNTSIPQAIVDIEITSDDVSKLKECIEHKRVEFIKQFAANHDLTQEEAYSLLLTQTMTEHCLPNKEMKELFELMEPDLTVFNKQNGYSLISILLTFGTRDNVLFLKEYINKYEWEEKVELDKVDQEAIHDTLLMGNALEVTQNEYVEFVTNLLGDICSEHSIHGALHE
jgi:tetratricopeptide (TPR) repeat protein